MYSIRNAFFDDVDFFELNVRDCDREEINAASIDPWGDFKASLAFPDEGFVFCYNEKPICLYGTSSHPSGYGMIFMIATDEIYKHKKAMHSVAKKYVSDTIAKYPLLLNYVYVKHWRAIRWLKSLGFTIADPVEYGINKELFHPFYMRQEDVLT